MSTPRPTPSTDMKITLAGTYTFPGSYTFPELAALIAERDQLRADCENETKWAAHYLAQSIADKARAERAEADAAAYLKRAESFSKLADEAEAEAERYRLVTLRQDAELAAEREKLDWVFQNCKVEANDYTTGNLDVYYVHDREDLGVAMKEDAK